MQRVTGLDYEATQTVEEEEKKTIEPQRTDDADDEGFPDVEEVARTESACSLLRDMEVADRKFVNSCAQDPQHKTLDQEEMQKIIEISNGQSQSTKPSEEATPT